MIVAIDGPAGAGKSTVSKELAKNLGFQHLDSGAFYRCYALYHIRSADSSSQDLSYLLNAKVEADYSGATPLFFLDGENVTTQIRTNQVSARVSGISANLQIREAVSQRLRETGKRGNFVVDGRDIGTVVFPDAELKIFLTASIAKRAKRRHLELMQKGEEVSIEILQEEIRKRDDEDSTREIAPLKQADDAILLDSSELDRAQVIEKMTEMVSQYIKNHKLDVPATPKI